MPSTVTTSCRRRPSPEPRRYERPPGPPGWAVRGTGPGGRVRDWPALLEPTEAGRQPGKAAGTGGQGQVTVRCPVATAPAAPGSPVSRQETTPLEGTLTPWLTASGPRGRPGLGLQGRLRTPPWAPSLTLGHPPGHLPLPYPCPHFHPGSPSGPLEADPSHRVSEPGHPSPLLPPPPPQVVSPGPHQPAWPLCGPRQLSFQEPLPPSSRVTSGAT